MLNSHYCQPANVERRLLATPSSINERARLALCAPPGQSSRVFPPGKNGIISLISPFISTGHEYVIVNFEADGSNERWANVFAKLVIVTRSVVLNSVVTWKFHPCRLSYPLSKWRNTVNADFLLKIPQASLSVVR